MTVHVSAALDVANLQVLAPRLLPAPSAGLQQNPQQRQRHRRRGRTADAAGGDGKPLDLQDAAQQAQDDVHQAGNAIKEVRSLDPKQPSGCRPESRYILVCTALHCRCL